MIIICANYAKFKFKIMKNPKNLQWKEEETFRLPFTQQGVAGRGEDEKKKIDGEKIHTRGEKMPQGASTDFYL